MIFILLHISIQRLHLILLRLQRTLSVQAVLSLVLDQESQLQIIYKELLSILTMIFTAIVLALMFPKLFKKLDYELSVKDVFKKAFTSKCDSISTLK